MPFPFLAPRRKSKRVRNRAEENEVRLRKKICCGTALRGAEDRQRRVLKNRTATPFGL